MFDIFEIKGSPQDFFDKLNKMHERLEDDRNPGSASGGLVTVSLNGKHELIECKIDPVLAGDVELIEDLMVAAVADAVNTIRERTERGLRNFMQHMSSGEQPTGETL